MNNNLDVREDEVPFIYQPYVEDRLVKEYEWYPYQPRYQVESDVEIKEEIEEELFWSPFIDPEDVKVSVKDRTARLDGTVSSWSEYDTATENAFEGGAIRVYNNLVVKPQKE